MSRSEAKTIVTAKMKELAVMPYFHFKDWIYNKNQEISEVVGESGKEYCIEIEAMWDDKPNGNIRVLGSIDSGGWDYIFPVCCDFIISSDGKVLAEWDEDKSS